jgi:hypothetical protein
MSIGESLSRREFAGRVAAGAAPLIAVEAGNFAGAQEKKPDDPKPVSLVEWQLEMIRQLHPDQRLDAAALAEIRDDLETQRIRAALLSQFPLTNGDEPVFVVHASVLEA